VASCGGGSYPSPREARDPARQALRPGCEELAVTDPLPAEAQAEGGSGERSAAKTATVEPLLEPSGVKWSSVEGNKPL
jgi:hypothetical protein